MRLDPSTAVDAGCSVKHVVPSFRPPAQGAGARLSRGKVDRAGKIREAIFAVGLWGEGGRGVGDRREGAQPAGGGTHSYLTERGADRIELSLVSELVQLDKAQAEKLVRALVLWLERDVVLERAFSEEPLDIKGPARAE